MTTLDQNNAAAFSLSSSGTCLFSSSNSVSFFELIQLMPVGGVQMSFTALPRRRRWRVTGFAGGVFDGGVFDGGVFDGCLAPVCLRTRPLAGSACVRVFDGIFTDKILTSSSSSAGFIAVTDADEVRRPFCLAGDAEDTGSGQSTFTPTVCLRT